MSKLPAPNYTQIPNIILDDLLPKMGEAELRVILAIARQTFGWHKASDRISLSQLQEITGMSRPGVLSGISAGLERGIIVRRQEKHSYRYSLLVNDVDQQNEPASQRRLLALVNDVDQQLVNDVYPQNKELKKEKESVVVESENIPADREVSPTPTNGKANGKSHLHANMDPRKIIDGLIPEGQGTTPLEVYREAYATTPTVFQIRAMMDTVSDLARWREVCKTTALKGWKSPANVLDAYQNGTRDGSIAAIGSTENGVVYIPEGAL